MPKCIIYTINKKNQIVDEQLHDDSDTAISIYFNKRDSNGDRYHIELNGNKPPYKHKKKELRNYTIPNIQPQYPDEHLDG